MNKVSSDNKKIKFLLCFALAMVYVFLCANSVYYGGDFEVYLNAAQRIQSESNIYAAPHFKDLQYYYSPLFATLLIPFSNHWMITELLWLLLSGGCFVRTCYLIQNYFDLSPLRPKGQLLWAGISLLLVIRFVLYNISTIQITLFLLWVIFESIQLFGSSRLLWGAVLLALGINIKVLPIILLPYLLYRARFNAFICTVFFVVLFLYLPRVFIGAEYNSYLLSEWWNIINPLNKEHVIEADINSQSIVGIIPAFFTDISIEGFTRQRNFVNYTAPQVASIINFLRLFLVAFTLYFLRRPFRSYSHNLQEFRAIAYMCLLVPLVFPHQQKYSFLFLFPMLCYLWYYAVVLLQHRRSPRIIAYIIMLSIISVVFTPLIGADLIGRYAYDWIHYYKILGLAALALIPFAVFSRPSHVERPGAA
ncbi:MAG: glycosyltransferase family 87 protein [Bacteroidota bacterium]